MEITARKAAHLSGHTKYLGKPCRHGHSGLRYVSTGGCVDCCCNDRYRRRTPPQSVKSS